MSPLAVGMIAPRGVDNRALADDLLGQSTLVEDLRITPANRTR